VPEPLVYLNGRRVPASQAALPIWDAGIAQGATVTEQTRTFRHRPWRLDNHLDRLFDSLRYAGIEPGLSKDEFAAISNELVTHNATLIGPDDDLGLIQFVTAGAQRRRAGRRDQGRRCAFTPSRSSSGCGPRRCARECILSRRRSVSCRRNATTPG